jgi:excisionase family DNA binding protein
LVEDIGFENGVSTAEAARILGLNVQTVRKLIWRGKLPAVQMPYRRGFRWRVLVDGAVDGAPAVDPPSVDQISSVGGGECCESLHREADASPTAFLDRRNRIAELEEELLRIQGSLGLAKDELEAIRRRIRPREGLGRLRESRQLASTLVS